MTEVFSPLRITAGPSPWALARRRFRHDRAAMVALGLIGLVVLFCLGGPLVWPHAHDEIFTSYVDLPPSLSAYPKAETLGRAMGQAVKRAKVELEAFSVSGSAYRARLTSAREIDPRIPRYLDRPDEFTDARVVETLDEGRTLVVEGRVRRQYFPFGTDRNGRDLLPRVMVGGQVSLTVGLLATLVSLAIGVTYGAVSGYLGGRVDMVMMRLVEILYSLPFMFFVIMLVVFLGRHFVLIFVAIGAVQWLDMARIVRSQTLSLKRREFVEAARAMGLTRSRIILRHIIPNTLGPVVIFVTVLVPQVILLESFLSFLGLGVQEPMTSWGTLIAEGTAGMRSSPWLLIFPAAFFIVTLYALNFAGDGLRDALDPKES